MLRDGRVVYIGGERVDDVTRHPAFRDGGADGRGDLRHEGRSGQSRHHDLRGGRRPPLDLFPASRRPATTCRSASDGHRRIADFTYGMFGRSPDHVASFVTGMAMKPDALPTPHAYRRQPAEVLPPHPRQRHLRGLRGGAAAGRAQSGVLSEAEHPGADAAGRARGRRRRRDLRHEDAGDRRALRQRDLDRQRHSARARPEEGGDHLRDPVQRAGTDAVVAQARRGRADLGVRFAAGLALRRERQHADVRRTSRCRGRRCSCTTTRCCRATSTSRRRAIASATTSRTCATGRRCGCCSACAAGSPTPPAPTRCRRCARSSARWRRSRRPSAAWSTARSTPSRAGPRATSASTAASCMPASNGARRTTAASSMNCARCAAAACSRCRRTSR